MNAGATGKQQEQNQRWNRVPTHARIILVAQSHGQVFEPLTMTNDILNGAWVADPELEFSECISAARTTRAFETHRHDTAALCILCFIARGHNVQ